MSEKSSYCAVHDTYPSESEPCYQCIVEYKKKEREQMHGHPMFYELLDDMAELHSRKNHDYAGQGSPLRNFYKCEQMGIDAFSGIMVRLSDKWSRLESFMRQGVLNVKSESVEDTLMDNAVYSLLAIIVRREERKTNE